MTTTHWFWLALTSGCVLWYATITVYVAIRGAWDIRHMITQLGERKTPDEYQTSGD